MTVNTDQGINVMSKNTTAASSVIQFDFRGEGVRAISIHGDPWFVASDVCRILEVENTTQAVQVLDDDERSMFNIGRQGKANIVSESGLYTLILRSRDAVKRGSKAHAFRKWVTAEVLPAIRKHGRYVDEAGKMDTLLGSTIGTNGFNMLAAVIKGKVAVLPKETRRRATMKIWSQAHTAFGVRSAQDIPADQLDAARNFVAAYALEGEWLPKQKYGEFVLDFYQAQEVCHLVHNAIWCVHHWDNRMAAGVKAMNYSVWLNAFEHFQEAGRSARRIGQMLPDMFDRLRGKKDLLPEDCAALGLTA